MASTAIGTGSATDATIGPEIDSFALVRFTASAAAPSPVQVGSLTASSTTVTAGSPVTLTAGAITTTNAGATITQVAFYSVDSFGTEQLLGYGTANADGTWTLLGLAPGWRVMSSEKKKNSFLWVPGTGPPNVPPKLFQLILPAGFP